MLPQLAYIVEQPETAERRGAHRRSVHFGIEAQPAPRGQRIVVLNLSETGLRFVCPNRIEVGESLDFELPEAGEVAARVIWRDENEYGAVFNAPVTRAVVSATMLASPPVRAAVPEPKPRQAEVVEHARSVPLAPWIVDTALSAVAVVTACLVFSVGFLQVSGWAS